MSVDKVSKVKLVDESEKEKDPKRDLEQYEEMEYAGDDESNEARSPPPLMLCQISCFLYEDIII